MNNNMNNNGNNSRMNNGMNNNGMNNYNNGNNSRKNMRKNNSMTRRQSGGAHMSVGSRVQVMHGTADHTAGGLKKADLMMHKGRIVSRKAHAAGKKAFARLRAAGYAPKKGTFKLFTKKSRKNSRKH